MTQSFVYKAWIFKLLWLVCACYRWSAGFSSDQCYKAIKESDFLEEQSNDLVEPVFASFKCETLPLFLQCD